MIRPRSGAPRAMLARAIGVAFLVALAMEGPALAASPSPSAEPGGGMNPQAWVDQPLTPDATAGAVLPIGFTMWDPAHNQLLELNEAIVRLRPAKGSAKPTEAKARSDWPGHLITEIEVPKGGPGRIEVLFEGETCTSDGTCTTKQFPFGFGGYGPPPNAPRSLLVNARILSTTTAIAAGEPLDIIVDVTPKADWDPAKLALPDTLVVFVSSTNGPDEATTTLNVSRDPRPEPGAEYSGQITIPEAGTFRLFVAIPGNGTEDQVIASILRLIVTGGDAPSPSARPSGDAPAPAAPSPPWPLIVGGIAAVVAGAYVIRVAFADL